MDGRLYRIDFDIGKTGDTERLSNGLGGEGEFVSQVVVPVSPSEGAIGIRGLQNEAAAWLEATRDGVKGFQELVFIEVLEHVGSKDDIEFGNPRPQVLQHVSLNNVGDAQAAGYPDLLSADVDAVNVPIALASEEVDERAVTAANIQNLGRSILWKMPQKVMAKVVGIMFEPVWRGGSQPDIARGIGSVQPLPE
jgi:hypothetical protein